MNILGPDALVFGVDDLAACAKYLTDYGLEPVGNGRFEALDGTAIVIKAKHDPTLPAPLPTATMLRKTIYGVADEATLTAIAEELGRDRAVRRLTDGSLEATDDAGFVLGFQLSVRRPISLAAETVNAPGAPAQRPANVVAFDASVQPRPRSLSHVVYFVPDFAKAEAFYARLGFVCTDRFTGVGPFLRPAGTVDHHTLFLIQTPPHMTGCEHFTFHMAGPTEVMQAGTRFVEKGYQSFWGPGRHIFGSNWFWYFNSPLGCHVEYDADMDLHDDAWTARVAPMGVDTSQLFLMQHREKWAPGGPPPGEPVVIIDEEAQLLGPATDVPEGGARGYAKAGVFVVRKAGELHAYRDACPHYGDTPLAWRRDAYLDAAGERIVCSAHGAQFEIETGLCVLGPCLGQSLTRLTLTVNEEGRMSLTPKETPMTDPVKKALVIGGGFSGMACAIELAKRDVQVDLVEIDAGWRSYGAGISLGGPTLRVFRTLGILDAFLQHGNAADGLDICAPNGAPIAQLPTPRVGGPDVPGGGAILRPVLAKIMAEATRTAGVQVRLGCSFTAIEQDAEGVEVSFTDGSRGRYDVAVGADGLNSQVRSLFFPDAPRPTYTGQGVWRAVLARPASLERARMWMGGAVKPGVNPVSKEQMYMFVTEHRPNNERIPADQQPAMLRDMLAPFPDPLLQQLREQIDANAQVIYRPLESMLMPRPWSKGRVVLIGDAVHATTPHLASGACIGMEDGVVLAEELARAAGVSEALASFESRRWERCRMVVENSGRLGAIEIAHGDKDEHAQLMRASLMAMAQPI